jgi:hypothetical protein
MSNRLANETSPYLHQHAHNPVDWYAWGEEALARARAENKPIFLSIGYSSCHWCHVMAHESFEDPETAAIMNQHFVNIKVDREERPDLDAIYMDAVVSMTGSGGWPLSVFLTPDGTPFYGGTYFPAAERPGLPSFRRVLLSVAQAYLEKGETITQRKVQLLAQLNRGPVVESSTPAPSPAVLDAAYHQLAAGLDATHGGFGRAPKFPQPMNLEFLLRYHQRAGDPRALEMVDLTLTRMATGGIYDQLGGGFHRYATDARWLVPHFEKMLYDNALLARLYLHAWQVTRRTIYRQVVEATLDYVLREMTHPAGGFFSAQDADSEGQEGKYYVWAPSEFQTALGAPLARLCADYFGVTAAGNFEGHTILNIQRDLPTAAAAAGIDETDYRSSIEQARRTLLQVRQRRVAPGRDEKVLTAWNGLMLATLAEAGRTLHRPDYLQAAERNAEFVLAELRHRGRLLRSWKPDPPPGMDHARLNAYLEDYASYADGLLALYQATFNVRWYSEAQTLADTILAHFSDPRGGFYDTSDDHEALIVRPRQLQDNAMPSGNAMAVQVLLQLAAYTGSDAYRRPAEQMLAALASLMEQHSLAFGHWLCGLAFHLAPPNEIALVGDPAAADSRALLEVVFGAYRPHQVVALAVPGDEAAARIPLLSQREARGARATAYVCRGFACREPVTNPQALTAQLGGSQV